MRLAPFAIVYTKIPNLVVDLHELPLGVTQKSIEAMVKHISQLHREVRDRLKIASECYKLNANQHRKFKAFKVGNLVMVHLSKEHYLSGTYNKLKAKKIGPFPII